MLPRTRPQYGLEHGRLHTGGMGDDGGRTRHATRTTAAKASPPLLLLLPRPPLLLLPLPRLLLLLLMLSAHACKARRSQNHVNVPPSPPTKAPADHCEVWKGATHAGGGHAVKIQKIGKHHVVRVAHLRRRRCPRAQLLIHVHGGRRQHDPPTVPPTVMWR